MYTCIHQSQFLSVFGSLHTTLKRGLDVCQCNMESKRQNRRPLTAQVGVKLMLRWMEKSVSRAEKKIKFCNLFY